MKKELAIARDLGANTISYHTGMGYNSKGKQLFELGLRETAMQEID
jgi:hypothetical protein